MKTAVGSSPKPAARIEKPRHIEPIFDASGTLRYVREQDRPAEDSGRTGRD